MEALEELEALQLQHQVTTLTSSQPQHVPIRAAENERTGSESQENSIGNQHVMVLLSPSGKGRNKQNPRHPLTSMQKN